MLQPLRYLQKTLKLDFETMPTASAASLAALTSEISTERTVVTININGGHRPVPMMMAEAKSMSDTVSSVGEREIRASVSATFELD